MMLKPCLQICKPIFILLIFLLAFDYIGFAANANIAELNKTNHSVYFIKNNGQLKNTDGKPATNVLYYFKVKNITGFITNKGISYILSSQPNSKTDTNNAVKLDVELINATILNDNIVEVSNKKKPCLNFYLGNDVETKVYASNEIIIKNIYPGIDWVLQINDSIFKYSFSVASKVNPSIIKLKYIGAEKLALNSTATELSIQAKTGKMVEQNLLSMQQKFSKHTKYILHDNEIGFNIEKYDPMQPLIIDPSLVWSTFVGSNDMDVYKAIDVDQNNNLFVAGHSKSITYPTINAGTYFDNINNLGDDIVISKFNASMSLVWSTYYGGTSPGPLTFLNYYETANAIKLDALGNLYVAGSTCIKNFPTKRFGIMTYDSILNNGIDSTSMDGYLLKFSNNGSRIFATFLGGKQSDIVLDIDIDQAGNVFAVGQTASIDFPVQNLAGSFFLGTMQGSNSAFITKFNSNAIINWSTYFRGLSGNTRSNSISIDKNSNIFMVGTTNCVAQFPLQNNGGYYQANNNGITNVFISKFNTALALTWSTYYGGSNFDLAAGSTIDNNNNLIITGVTYSNDFPIYNNNVSYIQTTINKTGLNNHSDLFVVKFSNLGNRLWGTFLGGGQNEIINADDYIYFEFDAYWMNDVIKADKCGNFYLTTQTQSKDIGTVDNGCNSYFDDNLTLYNDAFIYKFSKAGKLKWATYYGGVSAELAMPIAISSNSDLFFAGTSSSYYGFLLQQTSGASYFSNYVGSWDGYILKFKQPDFSIDVNYTNCIAGCNASAKAIINSTCSSSVFTYLWNNGSKKDTTSHLCVGSNWVKVVDTAFTCKSDSFNFVINKNVKVTPYYSSNSCSFNCNAEASVFIPGNNASTNIIWHLKDTVIYNTNPIKHVCPSNDTLIVSIPGCGTDTNYFTINTPPFLTYFTNAIVNPDEYSCPLNCNGVINLIISGGQKKATCIWNNGSKGSFLNNICAGDSVSVLITDSTCFSTTESFVFPTYVPATASCSVINNCTSGKLVANVYSYGFATKFKFLWSSGDTTYVTKTLLPGTYTCTITSACDTIQISGTIVPIVVPPLKIKIIKPLYLPPCDTGCNGIALVTIKGGMPMYHYSASTGLVDSTSDSTFFVYNICANSWLKVKVIDGCGKVAYDSIKLPVHSPSKFKVSANQLNYGCIGDSITQASAISSGEHPPVNYFWSNGQTGAIATGLKTDSTYRLIGIDNCGYKDTSYIYIRRASVINLAIGTSDACKDICNGTAYCYISSGGIAPFSFVWSTGAVGALSISQLCHDSIYSCIVTDVCGSKDTTSVKIGLALPLSGYITTKASLCNPNCNATATLHYNGGINTQYFFYWSNNTFSQTANNLCTDSFYYCILSTVGCGIDTFNVHIPSYPKMITSCTLYKSACDSICNGIALVNISLGVPPYTVLWSSGETSGLATQLCVGQNYCVVTDSCGKTDTAFINIPALPNPIASVSYIHASCVNICNGAANAAGFGGTPPYKYLWSTGSTSSIATNLCFGNNTCIVTDACLSMDTVAVNILEYARPVASASINLQSCTSFCNGSATATATGGRTPYTYLWNTGSTTSTATNLCIGQNNCIVTDVCNKSDTTYVTIVAYTAFSASVAVNGVSCTNQCTGSATATGAGGKKPYKYLWSNGATTASTATLCKGNNFCIVTDDCGKKDTVAFSIGIYPTFVLTLDTTTLSCINTCNAFSKVSVTGGKTPYTYLWSNGATANNTNTLCIGKNYCIATDGCGIKDTVSFVIDTVSKITFQSSSFLNTPACNPCQGTITVNIINGWKPLTYQWSNGATTPTISNLCPSKYSLIVTNNYCTSDTIKFNQTIMSDLQTKVATKANATCYDTCNGMAKIKVWGGATPYSYLWSNGFTADSSHKFCSGIFTVKSFNALGGYCMDTVQINQPNKFAFDTLINPPHCFNKDGIITFVITGGTKPYQYLWSNGATLNTISNMPEGYYQISILDSNKCKINQTIFLKGVYPTVSVNPIDTLVGLGQVVNLVATGAVKYKWLNIANISCDTCKVTTWTSIYLGGTYCVEGIDEYGCADTACSVISIFDDCGFVDLPKAFTPNGDGVNDIYIPLGPCIEAINFMIFDRWGNQIFKTTDKRIGWDGKFKGEDMPQDAYAWHLIARTSVGRLYNLKGNVTLIR